MRYLLVYHRRLSEILRLFPACLHLSKQGHEVDLECDPAYHDIFACVDYVRPVTPGKARASYDRVLELAIGPVTGGTPARLADYRSSGRSWADFVYDEPDIRGSYGRTVFTNIKHCIPSDYGLPANGDYVLMAPVGSSQHVKYDPAKLGAWCHERWPRKSIHVLIDRPDKKFPPFVRARRLRDLPAIISWPRHFASINSAPAVIAAAVRPHYVHFPQTGIVAQDDTAFAGVSEVVQPYAGERAEIAEELKILRLKMEAPRRDPAWPAARTDNVPPLRIAFFTTLNHNVGDEFIREGIRAVFDSAGISYDPFFICKHKPETISDVWPEEVADIGDKYWNADVVVQAGAPVYWHLCDGESTSVTSEWHDWFWLRRVLGSPERQHPLFLNLGAGSCFSWGDNGERFVRDPECAEFARAAGTRAALTTVRETVASGMLQHLGVKHQTLPCPAFLAGARHNHKYRADGPIGVNLMPLGGHFELDGEHNQTNWLEESLHLLSHLRTLGRVVFIAHNEEEEKFLAQLAGIGEVVFRSSNWRAYLDTFAQCSLVVANRVHAAVCSAGLGVPSVILGNDTRAEIGRLIGLPIHRSGHVSAGAIFEGVQKLWHGRRDENQRLQTLRDATLDRYVGLIKGIDFERLESRRQRAAALDHPTVAIVNRESEAAPLIVFSKTDALGDQLFASGLVKALIDAHPDHHLLWFVRDGIDSVSELLDGAGVWRANMHCSPSTEAGRFRSQNFNTRRGWERVTIIPVPLNPYGSKWPIADTANTWWAQFANSLSPRFAVVGSVTVNWVDQLLVGATGATTRYGFALLHEWQQLPDAVRVLLPRSVRRPFTIEATFDQSKDELGQFEILANVILGKSHLLAPALAPRVVSLPAEVAAALADSLVIAPGAGAKGRALPPATTAEAVSTFLRGSSAGGYRRCLVIEGPSDREIVAQLAAHLSARKIPHQIFRLRSNGLATLVALLRAARLFLCNETSYTHLAAFAGTPTVAVWGLGHWPRFVCRAGSLTIVRTEMACRGCDWACCFDQWKCVQLIPAEAVTSALHHRANLKSSGTIEVQVVPAVVPPEVVRAAMSKRLIVAPPSGEAALAPTPSADDSGAAEAIDVILAQARDLLNREKLKDCQSILVEALRTTTDHPVLLATLGKALFADGKFLEAQKRFEQSLALHPDELPVLANLAATFLQLKNGRAAENLLARIFARDPNNVEALRVSAAFATQTGKTQLALQLLDRILATVPSDVAANLQIGQLLSDLGRHGDARKSYNAVLEIEPHNGIARRRLASLPGKTATHRPIIAQATTR